MYVLLVYYLLLYTTNHIWKLYMLTPLSDVIEDMGKFAEHLTKWDIIIVEGPGNSLDGNYYYSVTMDVNFLAEGEKTSMSDL